MSVILSSLLMALSMVIPPADGDFTILNFGPDLTIVQFIDANGVEANVAGLQTPDGVVVVNTFFDIGATAAALNIFKDRFDRDILYLFITNPTFERVGGNQLFKQYTIMGHHNANAILEEVYEEVEEDLEAQRTALQNLRSELERRSGEESEEVAEMLRRAETLTKVVDSFKFFKPTLIESSIFSDNRIRMFNKRVGLRLFYGATTNADMIVLFEEDKTVVCGDIIVSGSLPIWDATRGGSLRGLLAATEQILQLQDQYERVVPGFGDPGDFTMVLAQRQFLLDVTATVNMVLAEGGEMTEALESLSEKYASGRRDLNDLKAIVAQAWAELSNLNQAAISNQDSGKTISTE